MIITPTAQSNDAGTVAGTLQVTTNGVNLFDTTLQGNGTALSLGGNQILILLQLSQLLTYQEQLLLVLLWMQKRS